MVGGNGLVGFMQQQVGLGNGHSYTPHGHLAQFGLLFFSFSSFGSVVNVVVSVRERLLALCGLDFGGHGQEHDQTLVCRGGYNQPVFRYIDGSGVDSAGWNLI